MNKYELRTSKKKDAIISAALALFSHSGFQNTSIKQIAESAHVSQVSIYNYFGSKEALVTECAKKLMHQTLTKAQLILLEPISYIEKLNKALSLCTGEINEYLNTVCSEAARNDQSFLSLLSDGLLEVQKEMYTGYIEAGKKEGLINETIPTDSFMRRASIC